MTACVVTGAAGFIGSNLVRRLLLAPTWDTVVAFDALTYSGSLANLADVGGDQRFEFVHGDIRDREAVRAMFERFDPRVVFHLAAESHVDRSIEGPMAFVETNVVGTVVLLQEATASWGDDRSRRFVHVSTDEVFGSLGAEGRFDETTPYRPNSPYSASKAASDHFVRAWGETYELPHIITNCSNNYGPYQFPEKLIPVVVTSAVRGQPVPVYGDGSNVRDWLYVEDHCDGLIAAVESGETGDTYCFGGRSEVSNLELVQLILDTYDDLVGIPIGTSRELITFVSDRPGHDFRYAIDPSHAEKHLGWSPMVDLATGLRETIEWYLRNSDWIDAVSGADHRDFQTKWYEARGGRTA